MVSAADLAPELLHGVDRRIDVTPETSLRLAKRRDDFTEGRPANDEHVDVAGGAHVAFGDRSVDERDLDGP